MSIMTRIQEYPRHILKGRGGGVRECSLTREIFFPWYRTSTNVRLRVVSWTVCRPRVFYGNSGFCQNVLTLTLKMKCLFLWLRVPPRLCTGFGTPQRSLPRPKLRFRDRERGDGPPTRSGRVKSPVRVGRDFVDGSYCRVTRGAPLYPNRLGGDEPPGRTVEVSLDSYVVTPPLD